MCRLRVSVVALGAVLCGPGAQAYSVLTHEAIVDAVWDDSLKKELLRRYPDSTPEELREAHAYAYGGCIIQDMGYYPFGSKTFSDIVHYVRTGDFVEALLKQAANRNELAFALGALEHYVADIDGHRLATNKAVPLEFPKLRRRYGNTVTYWSGPSQHMQTEFGFDVVQVAQGHYAPDQYHEFIGFHVAPELLERVFPAVYGIEMKDLFASESLAFGTYRFAVSRILPQMTRVAWDIKGKQLQAEQPSRTRAKFLYRISRSSFEKEWGKDYQKPGIRTKIIAFILRLIPHVGPFRALKLPPLTPEVDKLFMASFNAAVDRYKALIAEVQAGRLQLANVNLDADLPVRDGAYGGSDQVYAELLHKLAEHKFAAVDPGVRQDIFNFYADPRPVAAAQSKKDRERAKQVDADLAQWKSLAPSPAVQK